MNSIEISVKKKKSGTPRYSLLFTGQERWVLDERAEDLAHRTVGERLATDVFPSASPCTVLESNNSVPASRIMFLDPSTTHIYCGCALAPMDFSTLKSALPS